MKIKIFTTGGTIDKIYADQLSDYSIGDSEIESCLKQARVGFDYSCESILKKDSLDMQDDDRALVASAVRNCDETKILITHGTDTMLETARLLKSIPDKCIVLTGAMQPSRFKDSDAVFNIGYAISALQHVPNGVYVCMNGKLLNPETAYKDRAAGRFVKGESN